MIGRYLQHSYTDNNTILVTFEVGRVFKAQIPDLKDKQLEIVVKPFKPKRSLDANALLWAVLGKLAPALRTRPDDLYRKYIREIGTFDTLKLHQIAYDKFSANWASRGLGWQTEIAEVCESDRTYIIKAYYGSSAYNSEEMARFIDYIREDAEEAGINVLTPEEMATYAQVY